MTLLDYTNEFEQTVLPLKKANTQVTFASHFRTFLPALGDLELRELTTPVVQRFITDLAKTRKPRTVHNIWDTLLNILRRAERNDLIDRLPRVDLPKVEGSEDSCCFSVEEMQRLITASEVPAFDALMAETGMRPGEALALTEQDIHHDSLTINKNIAQDGSIGPPKTRAGVRTLSISPWLRRLLQAGFPFLKDDGSPWCRKRAGDHIRRTCVRAGVQEGTAYGYRRGNATALISVLEVPEKIVAYRLGHKPLGLTLGLYARPVAGFDRDAANRLAKLLSGANAQRGVRKR